MRIAIVDDLAAECALLKDRLEQQLHRRNVQADILEYESGETFLEAARKAPFTAAFLDIYMDGMTGMEAAKKLRKTNTDCLLVFTTTSTDHALEGFQVRALHYLVKPVAVEKLSAVLSRAAEKLAAEPPFVVFSADGETIKLYEADIFYVESFRHELVVHAVSRDYRLREGISSFEQRLSADFFRVHRSYLVNLKQITRIGRTALTLRSGAELPVARGKYDDINRAFIARN